MRVVRVEMLVLHRFVPMLVLMPLRQMQPNTEPHKHPRHPKAHREPLAQDQNRNDRANKRSHGKVSTGSCRSNVPQREHEQSQAHAVAEKTNHPHRRQR
jgi:hypothetical protein